MRVFFASIVGLMCVFSQQESPGSQPPKFELRDGDRIALIGDTLIERDQRYGYLETLLSISNPDKNLVFRNLGWSGDTVGGISRSGFDPPEAGFEQLRQQILAVKPTVVLVGYGMADSFAGEAGLPAFEQGMNRLLNVIDSTKSRLVFLSPVAHANLGPPLPDPTSHNHDLARYRDTIQHIAQKRSAPFIDLFLTFEPTQTKLEPNLNTDDGIHLTGPGYYFLALVVRKLLGQDEPADFSSLVLEHDGEIKSEEQTKASHIQRTANGLRFEMTDRFVPPVPMSFWRRLAIPDLEPGMYELKIDGNAVISQNSQAWKAGVTLKSGPEFDQAVALRAAINRKNDLFFYRWRPQNNTYLLGFRKHEQGNNAVEIPQFDPLVAEQEKLINRLKKPATHVYVLSRVEKKVTR